MRAAAVLLFIHAVLLNACTTTPAVRALPAPFSACSAGDADGYKLEGHGRAAVEVEGDLLRVSVTHGGGCEAHAYQICWPSGKFDGSDPAVAALEVWHDSRGDLCQAIIAKTLTYDLAPLRDAWHQSHEPGAGTIRIVVGGKTVDYAFDR